MGRVRSFVSSGRTRKNADFLLSLLMAALLVLGIISLAAFDLRGVKGRPVDLEYPWVYLRDGEALRPEEQVVEIIVVGDIMLGRGVAGVEDVFSQAAPWLRAADLALGNFEGAITVANDVVLDHGSSTSKEIGSGTSEEIGSGKSEEIGSGKSEEIGSSKSEEVGTSASREMGTSTSDGGGISTSEEVGTGASKEGWTSTSVEEGTGTSEEIGSGGRKRDTATGYSDPEYAPYQLFIPEEASKILRAAGFDLLSLANNHTLDAGVPGLLETATHLKASGIEPLGVEPGAYIHEVDGLKVAFLALNLVPGGIDTKLGSMEEIVQTARVQADVVVVSVHWGLEYHLEPSPAQVKLADRLSQAGADLVLGHHPHVAQRLEILRQEGEDSQRDTLIAYSLGNFVFDQYDERTRQGLALRIFVDDQGLRAAQVLPVVAGTRPRLATLQGSAALLARVFPPPRRVGYACEAQDCRSIPVPQEERSGIFWAGQIDLTGDGVPEVVKRSAQTVTIYQGGEPVWRSPPEWMVLDVALGDPNNDGRGELLLALNKPDSQGMLTSHPFILGYRGGTYRVLWGGSAVSDPLLEIELGDLDGDAVQELIVLEEPEGGDRQTVSVWRWHGWGFSQLWRSPEGSYQDVILLSGEDGELSRISVVSLNGDANR